MVRTGVMRAWGDRLKNFIEHRVGNRLSAFMAGGLAGDPGLGHRHDADRGGPRLGGRHRHGAGLAVLLGARMWVPPSAIGGLRLGLQFRALGFAHPAVRGLSRAFALGELRPHNTGRVLIGLGLMLLSLTLIKQASAPLSTATLFHQVLQAVGG